jgi:ribonuclease P protein component
VYRQHRLKREEDFARVRAEGRSWSHRLLVLVARPNELGYARFGFVVPRRLGKAVVRNRARRLLREAARLLLPIIEGGWDIVLIAREPIRGLKMQQVRDALEQTLRRAGIARPETAPPPAREESVP